MGELERELTFVSMADVVAEEEARLDAMSMGDAVRAVLAAVSALMDHEGDRIGAHPFDWTYHGCEPEWRAVGKACADLAYKQFGQHEWRVPVMVIGREPPRGVA
jgi:hypothetical protein